MSASSGLVGCALTAGHPHCRQSDVHRTGNATSVVPSAPVVAIVEDALPSDSSFVVTSIPGARVPSKKVAVTVAVSVSPSTTTRRSVATSSW